MVEIANEPAVILICVVLASALFVTEMALPTLGLAGITGAALVVLAAIGIEDADLDWWPLSLAAVAVGLWCVMIARRKTSTIQQGVAVGLFTAGALGFGILAEDAAAIVLALISAVGVAVGFPFLIERSNRLLDAPSDVGMDSLVGKTATVTSWAGGSGKVMLQGSLWNASGLDGLTEGDEVVVSDFEGMSFTVRRPAPQPGGTP
jgi:membrane-bound ClpP family serine protease